MTQQGQHVISAIVGARFRPPASGLLSVLGAGSVLTVRREPENPYDPNALQVLVSIVTLQEAVPEEQLRASVEGFGFGLSELFAQSEWHLGYVPRTEAVSIAPNFDQAGVREVSASLTFDLQGRPSVAFVVP
jgi:HIRAN domain